MSPQPTPCINAIATATPAHEVHEAFIRWARHYLGDTRQRSIFERMVDRSQIDYRWSVLPPPESGGSQTDIGGFYDPEVWPGTAQRMTIYASEAPRLAAKAAREVGPLDNVTHLVVASCTGFVAPGIDQLLARTLGLSDGVERTLIGFMGCYAAVSALRTAYHIVRSQPLAEVLVVTVELSSLHLQQADNLKSLTAMLLFGDGAAAALVSARPKGLTMGAPFSLALPDSDNLITWNIGDNGFEMGLSGEVPDRIDRALADFSVRERLGIDSGVDSWAVHAGGRTVLDAVESGLGLPPDALGASREVLRDFGNMSSSTLMFVLAHVLARGGASKGVAMAFGPGMAVEGFHYGMAL